MVIRQTLADAREAGGHAVVVTFDRHPAAVVAPDRCPPMVYPLWRRLEAIESLGVDATLVFTFDTSFSQQTGQIFIERLLGGFQRVLSICVGDGFVFGHRRSGDVALLRRLGEVHGFRTHGIPPFQLDGGPISSTRVRDCVAAGDFNGASKLLGRPYTLAGKVGRGNRLGHELGYPTANLDITGLVLPPSGVYAALAIGQDFRRAAAVNIGHRPTVDGSSTALHVEAHLLDHEGDLYGQHLELAFDHRLRSEVRFPDRDALVRQITADVAAVRAWQGNKGLP
jgi:riboflavin kinase/FMN adenylyltransferase